MLSSKVDYTPYALFDFLGVRAGYSGVRYARVFQTSPPKVGSPSLSLTQNLVLFDNCCLCYILVQAYASESKS